MWLNVHVYTVCTYVCMYVCMYTYVCMYVYIPMITTKHMWMYIYIFHKALRKAAS